jgi:glycosyltransferase involved in cell wall biosynthesis
MKRVIEESNMGTQVLERDKGRSRLRILVIDQMGVLKSARKKFEELSKYQDLELILLAPAHWRLNYKKIFLRKEGVQKDNYRIVAGTVIFSGNSWRGFYCSNILRLVSRFEPHIIHVFQEPWSLFTFQSVIVRNLFSPKSKVVFLTWENIYRGFTYPSPLSNLYACIEKYIYKNVDCATPTSEQAAMVLKNKGFGKRIRIIPWGTNLELFRKVDSNRLKEKLGLRGFFVIGYVGRLVKEKGILTLIEAAFELKCSYKILIIGNGPLKDIIINKAALLGIDKYLVFVDTVDQLELVEYYNCMSVLVLPSYNTLDWKEQFGRVLIEAMACQVPVIGSDCGEIPNVIGEAGLVFSQQNSDELKRALVKLIKNPTLREELAHEGYQRVLVEYTWSRYAQETYKLYKELMNNNL